MIQDILSLSINTHMRYLAPFVLVLGALAISDSLIDLLKRVLVGANKRSAR